MGPYPFLSEEWIEAAQKLQAEYAGRVKAPALQMRMNLVVTGVPFGDGTEDAHLDTTSGELVLNRGHVENPDLKVTLDYETARAILVYQDQQAAMNAFMGGRIKIEGDMTKLLALQGAPPDPVQAEVGLRVREMTE